MQKSVFPVIGLLLLLILNGCSNQSLSGDVDMSGSAPPKFKWPQKKSLTAKQEESFNLDFTTLDGTFKSGLDKKGRGGSEFHIEINENDILFAVPYQVYPSFRKDEFMAKVKSKPNMPLKFLVEHLDAEQPHADPDTGALRIDVYGLIAGNDNIDLASE